MFLCIYFGFRGILWTEKSGVIVNQGIFLCNYCPVFQSNNYWSFPCFLTLSKEKPRRIAGSNAVPIACDAHTLRSRLSILSKQLCYQEFNLLHFIINCQVKKAHKGHMFCHSLQSWNIIAQLIIFPLPCGKKGYLFTDWRPDFLFH